MVRVFDAPIVTNDQSVDRLFAASLPVLLVFWRGRNIPDSLNQRMVSLAEQKAGDLLIARINVEDNPQTATQFDVSETPLLIGVVNGHEVQRSTVGSPADLDTVVRILLGEQSDLSGDQTVNRLDKKVYRSIDTRPLTVVDADFEQKVLRSDLPVLVDFWAPWCAPCQMIAPVLDRLAREYAGRIRVAKVNVDNNPHMAGVYGVQGIPTLLIFKNGRVVERLVGALPEQHLQAKIRQHLAD